MRARVAAVVAASAVGLAGCTGGVYSVTLPGGPNLGSHPYSITAQFTNVLDLVPQASVKVNDVDVGQVRSISLGDGGRLADVRIVLNGDVHLPANATASIAQTSLLGEKFVAITSPPNPEGTLRGGAVIPVTRTDEGVQLEQVFGALSMLLNGGGVGQLHTIVAELGKAVGGDNATALRQLLNEADSVVRRINARRGVVIGALNEVNALAATLNQNRADIAVALRGLPAGLRVLAGQRHQLVGMLEALGRLSKVTVTTVRASGRQFVGDLRALAPTLHQLVAAGSNLPRSLQLLLTYPFPDSVLRAIRGDYINAFLTTDLNTPGGHVVKAQTGPPALLPPVSNAGPGLQSSTVVTTPARTAGGGR